ncbi:MAG: response regulator transcription factor [Opitutaceae bacterium]
MIVDDQPVTRRLHRRVIRGFAADVVECQDGKEAVSAYELQPVDVVLMDFEMPVLDGVAARRAILEKYPSANIIMVTNCDRIDLVLHPECVGSFHYLSKRDIFQLPGLIESVLKDSEAS